MPVAVDHTTRARLRWGVGLAAVLSVISAAIVVAIQLGITIDLTLGGLHVHLVRPWRPFALGLSALLVLLSIARRRRSWMWGASGLAMVYVGLGLALTAAQGVPRWAVEDDALGELYTIHALQGRQLLGPYSQFGWHHPGPLLYYLFAPLYALSRQANQGLNAGALLLNLVALGTIVRMTARHAALSTLPVSLSVTLLIFFARLPQLLISTWNPHVTVMPFVALMIASAAAWVGDGAALPVAAYLASFVAQSHVGYAPVAVALLGLSTVGALVAAWERPAQRRVIAWSAVAAIELVQLLWLLPIGEQIGNDAGNLTQLWQYFFDRADRQTWTAAASAWSTMLLGVARPSFQLMMEGPFADSTSTWLIIAAILLALMPSVVAVRAFIHHDRFLGGFAFAIVTTAVVGAWSTYRIRGVIGDYQVFWLSAVGTMGFACLLTAALGRYRPQWGHLTVTRAMAGLVIGATVIGGTQYVNAVRDHPPEGGEVLIQRLVPPFFERFPLTGNHRPIVRFDTGQVMWPVASGVILQLVKARRPFALMPGPTSVYGADLVPTGGEDALVDVCQRSRHLELLTRPGNIVLAQDDEHGLYIDQISLIDFPALRPR